MPASKSPALVLVTVARGRQLMQIRVSAIDGFPGRIVFGHGTEWTMQDWGRRMLPGEVPR